MACLHIQHSWVPTMTSLPSTLTANFRQTSSITIFLRSIQRLLISKIPKHELGTLKIEDKEKKSNNNVSAHFIIRNTSMKIRTSHLVLLLINTYISRTTSNQHIIPQHLTAQHLTPQHLTHQHLINTYISHHPLALRLKGTANWRNIWRNSARGSPVIY